MFHNSQSIFPYIGLFLLLILGGIGLFFPEDVTLKLCGFLIAQEMIHPLRALVSAYTWLLIANIIIYHLGGNMVDGSLPTTGSIVFCHLSN